MIILSFLLSLLAVVLITLPPNSQRFSAILSDSRLFRAILLFTVESCEISTLMFDTTIFIFQRSSLLDFCFDAHSKILSYSAFMESPCLEVRCCYLYCHSSLCPLYMGFCTFSQRRLSNYFYFWEWVLLKFYNCE
jgi:hypothetical protein